MPYIKFSESQKQRAASVDLEAFLLSQGEKLLPSGREKRLSLFPYGGCRRGSGGC